MKKKPLLVYVDPQTSKIKEFSLSFSKLFIILIIVISLSILFLKYTINFIVDFSYNSKIAQLSKENAILQEQLGIMTQKVSYVENRIKHIEEIDDQIRTMLELPAIGEDVRQVGIGGSDLNLAKGLKSEEIPYGNELISNLRLLEKLEREIKLETENYRKLLATVERREDSLKYLPALKPVPEGRFTDGFGNRRHPILKRIKFHRGIDLAANRGTPVIATANGYVTFAGRYGGYGKFITINHKYGFVTRYGHLNKIYVRVGQFVRRGDKIGEVGNTGLSTNPHLHYEVHFRGKPKNPKDYILFD